MKVRVNSRFIVVTIVAMLSVAAQAEPKKKVFNNSSDQVFKAALRAARERHVVTYVDEKSLMFTFETGRSITSEGFVANASVEPEGDDKSTLIINVQTKKGFSWGAGDRMADKFYQQVGDELAGDPQQKSAVKPPERAVAVPDPKAVPAEPSMTKSADGVSPTKDQGVIMLTSVPDGADVFVDGAFVGNTSATLKLPAGKHIVRFLKTGMRLGQKRFRFLLNRKRI